jgi:hypothetical protein
MARRPNRHTPGKLGKYVNLHLNLSDAKLLGAFRQLSAEDRAKLSGLKMSLDRQERDSSVWLGEVRRQVTRNWGRLGILTAGAASAKEHALCRILKQLGAPSQTEAATAWKGHKNSYPKDNFILEAFKQLAADARAELSGLDMPLGGQLRNSSLWFGRLKNQLRNQWNTLAALESSSVGTREQALRSMLRILHAPGHARANANDKVEHRHEQRKQWAKQLYAKVVSSGQLPSIVEATRLFEWLRTWQVQNWAPDEKSRVEFLRGLLSAVVEGQSRSDLQLLDGSHFPWPTTEVLPATRVGPGISSPMAPIGVLKLSGYAVGKAGLPLANRRPILINIYTSDLSVRLSANELAEWGRPATAERLQKLANTLAALARNLKRRLPTSQAISDWESDLDYLRRRYYDGVYDFRWPVTNRSA